MCELLIVNGLFILGGRNNNNGNWGICFIRGIDFNINGIFFILNGFNLVGMGYIFIGNDVDGVNIFFIFSGIYYRGV